MYETGWRLCHAYDLGVDTLMSGIALVGVCALVSSIALVGVDALVSGIAHVGVDALVSGIFLVGIYENLNRMRTSIMANTTLSFTTLVGWPCDENTILTSDQCLFHSFTSLKTVTESCFINLIAFN